MGKIFQKRTHAGEKPAIKQIWNLKNVKYVDKIFKNEHIQEKNQQHNESEILKMWNMLEKYLKKERMQEQNPKIKKCEICG